MPAITRRSTLALPMLALAGGARAQGAVNVPQGYPAEYREMAQAAQREGSLLIYSIMSAENWRPVIQGFNARYPGIRVETLDLPNARDTFERYLAERATNSRTGDLIATADPSGWMDFHERGELLDYVSPEASAWPAWGKPLPGLYTISADPLILIWNNTLVPEARRPHGFEQFVELAKSNGSRWRNKLTSYGAHFSTFGYNGNYAFIRKTGDKGWEWFAELARLQPRFERSGGPMTEKVTSGEYAAAWFVSAITFWPRLNDPARARLLGWSFIPEAQPMMMRGVGIPKGARNINAAKLMLDYIASAEGQRAFGLGGLTPARPDVKPGEGIRHTYSSIVETIGGDANISLVDYDRAFARDYDSFMARWKQTFGIR
ncbi:ABC transporter substrate-binding protein [Caldovatus sediminis]|uniref:ABC transporter substrate-binding protein n=1 Tax=Caldovatus sediminis TaxID=2041189 RepID=A0A8J3EBF7_9PROT|nr:extracellular solute-binding protein [Caldovatus sediminis]GGG26446.1 ABC transporter substrate-binding protein [Caldovatus sediminis]